MEEVKENSQFEIIIPDKIGTSYVPTEEGLRILCQEIAPAGMVLGK
ncbi:MAG: hypothetical protein KAV98_06430 [Dehalococcoidia bacterium]|nr:hypothetical protein [Dehalococcoidia bacterium]